MCGRNISWYRYLFVPIPGGQSESCTWQIVDILSLLGGAVLMPGRLHESFTQLSDLVPGRLDSSNHLYSTQAMGN